MKIKASAECDVGHAVEVEVVVLVVVVVVVVVGHEDQSVRGM
jgi:hypothetical protein